MDIPRTSAGQYEKGDRGFGVWAVQRGLNELGHTLVEDGVFGKKTKSAVRYFQMSKHITDDGVVGQHTTHEMCDALEIVQVHVILPPHLLVDGFCAFEGGFDFGAVNWSVPGGVDCGIVQRRVFDQDASDEGVKERAFDPGYQLGLLARNGLRYWRDKYWTTPNAIDTVEQAWRTAALRHNYPALADKLAAVGKSGLSSYYFTPQSWVPNVTFDDGHQVQTPYEWGQFYALGAPEHGEKGLVTQLVTQWP